LRKKNDVRDNWSFEDNVLLKKKFDKMNSMIKKITNDDDKKKNHRIKWALWTVQKCWGLFVFEQFIWLILFNIYDFFLGYHICL